MLVAADKPRIVTRYLGGLTAMQNANVRMVIWARNLARHVKDELQELSAVGLPSSEFVTLATDPVERVRHQLGKSRIQSHFLTHDIALLVTVFGELSKAKRIKVSLFSQKDGDEGAASFLGESNLMLICAYTGASFRPSGSRRPLLRRDAGGHVALFRSHSPAESGEYPVPSRAPGLRLHLEAAPENEIHSGK